MSVNFEDLRPLGRGAFGEVFAAVDAAGRAVAVKVLAPELASRADVAWAFADEFRRLARLAHPGFPAAYERGLTPDGLPYYTMALVEGPPLASRDARATLADLAAALAYLHGLGLVHGDVKPENVLLGPHGAVLIDVGMLGPVGRPRAEVAGSLAYMAPEALRRAPIEAAADLYALGVLGYELVEGHRPYAGRPGDILRGHLHEPVPVAEGGLGPFLARLMAKDPADRPSAAAVRVWLAGEPEPPAVVGLRAGVFVGREALQAAWQDALAASASRPATSGPGATQAAGGARPATGLEAKTGPGLQALDLVGGPGSGKTRALDELRLAAQLAGRAWAGATCLPDAGMPAAAVRHALAQAIPEPGPLVAAWLAGAPTLPELDPPARQAAAFAAAAEELACAARAAHGLALGFDDWHLADDASRAFLALLQRSQPTAPIALVTAADGPAGAFLAPLDGNAVAAWLESRLAGPAPEGLAFSLAASSEGRPLFLDLALEQMVASGALTWQQGRWTLTEATASTPSQLLLQAWQQRLEGLSPPAGALVAMVSQVPGSLPLPLLAQVAGEVDQAAEELVARGLLTVQAGRARLAHGVPASLWPVQPPAFFAQLAGQLDQDPLLAARLALLGDDDVLAARLAGEAGARTLALAAPAAALAWLQPALERLPATAHPAARLAIALPLAEASRFADRLPEALAAYDLALTLDPDPTDLARIQIGRGKVLQMQGRYADARQAYEAAEARAPEPGLRARAAVSLARVLAFTGEPAEARAAAERADRDARGTSAAVLVQALNMRGLLTVQADPAQAPQAIALLDEALELAKALGDRAGMALVLDNLGNAHLATGDLYQARKAFATYATHCRDAGFTTEALAAALNQALVAVERGDVPEALAFAETAERDAERAGRRFILACALAAHAQVLVRRGENPWEVLDRALALSDAIGNRMLEELVRLVRLEALLAEGRDASQEIALLEPIVQATGHAEAAGKLACARVEEATRHADRHPAGWLNALAEARRLTRSPNRVVAHRAHQLCAEAALGGDGQEALEHALQALAIATAWDAPWHLAADRALTARARLLAGDERGARQDARLVLQDPQAPARARAAMAPLAQAPAAGSGLDPAKYARWVEALAQAAEEGAIAAMALEGVMDLVQAERGYLIGYVDGRIGQVATRGIDYATEVATGFSQTMVQRVLYAGAPLYVADASTDAAWREVASVMALDLRAVVCLPLATPDAILGVIYVDRRSLEPAVGEGDLALLAAFATTAAAALRREGLRAEAEASYELVAGLAARLLAAQPEAVAQELLHAALELAGAERGFWLMPSAAGFVPKATAGDTTEPPSQGILDHVATTGTPLGILDLQDEDGWQDRRSVQALGLRSVWCLPTGAPDGALLYLDTTQPASGDPAERLQGLEALLRAAEPIWRP